MRNWKTQWCPDQELSRSGVCFLPFFYIHVFMYFLICVILYWCICTEVHWYALLCRSAGCSLPLKPNTSQYGPTQGREKGPHTSICCKILLEFSIFSLYVFFSYIVIYFWNNFKTTLRETVRQLWDTFGANFRKLGHYPGTIFGQLCNHMVTTLSH